MRHRHSITENPGQLVGIAALAASIGAVFALLFTPRTGGQARRGIKRRAEHLKDELHDTLHAPDVSAGDVSESAQQQIQTAASKAKSKTTIAADKAKDATDDAKTRIKRATK